MWFNHESEQKHNDDKVEWYPGKYMENDLDLFCFIAFANELPTPLAAPNKKDEGAIRATSDATL